MAVRETLDPDRSLWEWIAVDLHFYRIKHDMTLADVGEVMGCTRQTVSNLEACRPGFRMNDKQAAAVDKLWDINGHFGRLLRYARAGHDPDWFKAFTEYEARAISIKIYEALLIPGLLQTPEYTRALLESGHMVDDVDAAVEIRMERQQILTRPKPPQLWILLNESVLDQPVGGLDVMRAQLTRLLEASRLRNVVLRVIPRSVGAHIGLDGPFMILTGAREKAAYMEACGSGGLSLDAGQIERYGARFDHIGADALSRTATRSLITQVMERIAGAKAGP
ncbi:MAG TPA: DUF5753 domain-containing protein [Streptosporangiaceae bacterium]|jgi:transcriptional regulator with XRE-family HTH domain